MNRHVDSVQLKRPIRTIFTRDPSEAVETRVTLGDYALTAVHVIINTRDLISYEACLSAVESKNV